MSSSRRQSNFLVQGTILAFTSILVRIIGLVYRIPMTNILGDEGIGYYDYAFEVYNMAFILSSYGMPMAVSKLVADRSARREYKNSFKAFSCALMMAGFLGGVLSLAVYFGAGTISKLLFANSSVQIPLRVLAPTIFICAILGVLRGFFQGKNTMVPTAVSQLIEQLVNGIVSVAAAYYLVRSHSASEEIAAYGAAGGVLGTGIGAFFGLLFILFIFVVNLPVVRRQLRRDRTTRPESYRDLFLILLYTVVPVTLSQILIRSNGLIAASMFSHILSGKGFTKEAYTSLYGVYSSKYLVLCNIVIGVTSAVTTAMVPAIVSAHAVGAATEVRQKISAALKFNLIIAFPSMVGLGLLGGPILQLLFHDSSDLAAGIMLSGSCAVVLYTISILFNTIIQSIHKMMLPVLHSGIAILIDVVVLYLLLQFTNLGPYALVIGNLVLPIVVIFLNWIVLKRDLTLRLDWLKSVVVPALSSLIMGVIIMLVYQGLLKLSGSNTLSVLVSILSGILLFFLCLILLKGITEDELYNVPNGTFLIRIFKKIRLMR